jgi:ribose transport system substrate-binding protein
MARGRDPNIDNSRYITRRHALECMTSSGAGVVWALSSGVASSAALSGRAGATPAIAQTKPTIPIIVKDKSSFYWQTVLAGARKAGQDLGIDVLELGPDGDSDPQGQVRLLESAVTSNPAAVVIAPAGFAALGKPIDEAARKVKVIAIDSEVDSKAVTSLLKTDNIAAGRRAADILATAIQRTYADAEGEVAIIMDSMGLPSFEERSKGFKQQLAAKYGALQIVADKVADRGAATGFNVMAELINAHPELRGVCASSLFMAQGAAQALVENNMANKTGDLINLIGFDWDDKVIKFLQDGAIAGLIVQDPFRMGYDGIKTALAASKSEPVPARVDTGASLITKANLSSPRSQELLHPKI